MAVVNIIRSKPGYHSLTEEFGKCLASRLIDMDCNQREPERCSLEKGFKSTWKGWNECEKEYIERYSCTYGKRARPMIDIVEAFRPHKSARGNSLSTINNDPKEHPFFSGMYEEYVGVLLCWEERINSMWKKECKGFYE